ncbi:MAG: J domain-containing protein [Pseudomonadota bacterium]
MSSKDYYKILGVDKDASEADIKKAYKKYVRNNHPDKFTDPEEKKNKEKEFKEAVEAYETLSDSQKRQQYDVGGSDPFGGGHSGFSGFSNAGRGGFAGFSSTGGGDIFEEIFSAFTGKSVNRRRKHTPKQPGNNIRTTLQIKIHDAYFGCQKKIKLQYYMSCNTCESTGSKSRRKPDLCSMCRGEGVMQKNVGFTFDIIKCSQCLGSGLEIVDPCGDCSGQGRSLQYYEHNLQIPEGILDGHKIVLSGKGEAGIRGGRPGDLFIILYVEKDDEFKLKGADVYKEVELSMFQAAMGAKLEVKTVSGAALNVTIQPGCQSKTMLKLANKGFKKYNSSVIGDMYLVINVKIIKITSDDHCKKLQQIETDLENEKNHGFFF